MRISNTTSTGKLSKAKHIDLVRVTSGSIGLSTGKGMAVTLCSNNGEYVTIQAYEFALMRKWFNEHGCEE